MRRPDTAELLALVVHWLSLWLGLYLVSRRPRSAPTVLTGAAIVAMSLYPAGATVLLDPLSIGPEWDAWARVAAALSYFAPVFLLHAMVRLTAVKLPSTRVFLGAAYLLAGLVGVLDVWGGMLDEVTRTVDAAGRPAVVTVRGPFYSLALFQVVATLAATVAVVTWRRLARPRPTGRLRRQLDLLVAGTSLMFVSAALMAVNAGLSDPLPEGWLEPGLVAGTLLLVLPLTRYAGLVEGQLLRNDLWSSLVGVVLLIAGAVALGQLAGATTAVYIAGGWVLVACYAFADDLKGFADRLFFGPASRAQRAGLRTVAKFAGSSDSIDLAMLLPEQSSEVVSLLAEVDRAALASAAIEDRADVRLELLGRDEFVAVRGALGLSAGWTPADGLPLAGVRTAVTARLEPRERQALGLRYLGYSDKEMARLMGVRPNVPRSYLSAGKRKLGLPAGASLMLFVHLAGLLESDALPLLASAGEAAGDAT